MAFPNLLHAFLQGHNLGYKLPLSLLKMEGLAPLLSALSCWSLKYKAYASIAPKAFNAAFCAAVRPVTPVMSMPA